MFKISRISPSRLYVKGPPKFATININHNILKNGQYMRNPVLIKYLRECDRSYIIFAPANIAEEQNPWAIMIIIPPSPPIGNSERKPMITNDMCTTDE